MDKVEFSCLLKIYRASNFAADGKNASLFVENTSIREALLIAIDEDNIDDSGISIDGDPDKIEVGNTIKIFVQAPKISLGYLAVNFNALLAMRRATFEEPKNYYLIQEKFSRDEPAPPFCLLYTSPSPRDRQKSRMPSSA